MSDQDGSERAIRMGRNHHLTRAMPTTRSGTRKIEIVTPRPQRSWWKATSYECEHRDRYASKGGLWYSEGTDDASQGA
jgi:hypothetical protein